MIVLYAVFHIHRRNAINGGTAMDDLMEGAKSCGPQLFEDVPHDGWGLEQLTGYANAQHAAIEDSEQMLTPVYWRLGLALRLARRHFARGQWGHFLQELGIEKTRASKACAIHRAFESEQLVEGLTVEEAYARRKRKPRKTSPRDNDKNKTRRDLGQWLLKVCREADGFLDVASNIPPNKAASLVPAVDAAIDELQVLRRRLAEQAPNCTSPNARQSPRG